MKTDIEYISSTLKDKHLLSASYIRQPQIGNIASAMAVVKLPKTASQERLYIIHASSLSKHTHVPDLINLACIEDAAVPSRIIENQTINLLLLKEEAYIPEIHDVIDEIHTQQKTCSDALNQLIQRLYYGHGLLTVVEIGESVFQNPVFLMDVSFRSIGCSKIENIRSQPVKEAATRGYMDVAGIAYIKEHGWNERTNLTNTVSFFPCDYEPESDSDYEKGWYNCFVKVNGCVVGHISVLTENKPLPRVYQDFLTTLAKVTAMEYKANTAFLSKDGALYETLLINLIENKITDQMTIIHLLSMLNRELKKYLFVVTIRKTDILTNKNFSAIEQENRECN